MSPRIPEGGQPPSSRTAKPSCHAPNAKGPGFFAAIDGPSGVGKTTVTELTARQIAACGLPVLATRQPSDSALGLLARSAIHDLRGLALTCLMAADRHHHYEHVIRPAADVTRAIRSAIARIRDRARAAAAHLDQSVSTGTRCSYAPSRR